MPAYALSWVMAFIGMSVRSPEVINNLSFLILFPLTFLSNAFVPSNTLPTPLRIFAEYNPVSALVQAARELFGNVLAGTPVSTVWTQRNPIQTVLIGIAIMLVVFVPLSIRKYRQISTRQSRLAVVIVVSFATIGSVVNLADGIHYFISTNTGNGPNNGGRTGT